MNKVITIRAMMLATLLGACGSDGYDGTAVVPRRDAVEWIGNVVCDRARDCGTTDGTEGWCEWNLVESVCQHGLCEGNVEVGPRFDACLEAWETWPCDRAPVPPVDCLNVLPTGDTLPLKLKATVFKPGKPIGPTDADILGL